MAKVRRKPTQEHHSNCNCAGEARMAELLRKLWGGTMAGCRQLCRQLERGRRGGGEWRQGRWWLLCSPRLAGPITDKLNMTELTLLSYSERKWKINGVKRLQHWLYEIKKVSSFLAAPNAIRATGPFTQELCGFLSNLSFSCWPPNYVRGVFFVLGNLLEWAVYCSFEHRCSLTHRYSLNENKQPWYRLSFFSSEKGRSQTDSTQNLSGLTLSSLFLLLFY